MNKVWQRIKCAMFDHKLISVAMPKASPQQIGTDVARALGLPPDNLVRFTLSCDARKATIEATFLVPTDGQLEEVLKSYMVVERG